MSLMKTKVMVSKIGQISIRPSSKKDPCGIWGIGTMANAVLCKSCGNWIYGRCSKIKRVTNRLVVSFRCRKCNWCLVNVEEQKEHLVNDMETVIDFSYLGDRINSVGGCEAAVTSRTRLGWMKLRDYRDLFCGKKFPHKIKESAYKNCERSAMLYGSETWCLGQNEAGI